MRLAGLVVMLALGSGCGDDGTSDSGASSVGSSDGGGSTGTSTTSGSTGSSEDATSSSSTGPGTTSAVDDTSASTSLDPSGSSDETAIPDVAFGEVLVVIGDNCFCHRSPMFQGQLDLRDDAAYASLVSVPSIQAPGVDRVVPGDPSGSYLYLKLLGDQATVGGSGTRMPQGLPMLPPEELDLFRYWIQGGANP
ncbi:hypothetical protein [Paraliomyxa miuraensis]|uniref:hypothetical protein n=1 Tax=Paraliomyxa miuraensis TaxID=376150 RepID=UPI002252F2B4|nr:hypothetical protein [Paraliomyxa miuraensis]MCX4245202.1 hypothetical protein [Paraliomyxa miuraensis]